MMLQCSSVHALSRELREAVVDAQRGHPRIAQARQEIAGLVRIADDDVRHAGRFARARALLVGRRPDRDDQEIADLEPRRRAVGAFELEMRALRRRSRRRPS